MAHVQLVDELVREYLAFRGFAGAVKSFDAELKGDRERGFRADRIVEQLLVAVNGHDLHALRELWAHLDSHTFSKLEAHFAPAAKKLENGLLKLYLVTAVGAGRTDKVTDFLAKMTPELQGQSEWRDWYALPYTPKPDESQPFAVYFGRQWQDALLTSLHNLIATAFQCLPQPTLSSFEAEAGLHRRLREENAALRQRLAEPDGPPDRQSRLGRHSDRLRAPQPLTDDFYVIPTPNAESAVREARGLRGLIRQMGGSPVLGKKQTRSLSQT